MVQGIYQSPNKSITCLVNQTREVFIIQIIGRVHFKYYKEAFEVTLTAQEMHPYTQVIVNFRDIKLSPDNLRFWFVFSFIKNFYKTKKELKLAIVFGTRLWDRRFIGFWLKLRAILGSKVVYEFFENIREAENWMYGIEEQEEEDFTFFQSEDSEEAIVYEEGFDNQDYTMIQQEESEDNFEEAEDLFTQLDKGGFESEEESKKEKKSFFGFLKRKKKEESEPKKEKKPLKVQVPKVRIKLRKK